MRAECSIADLRAAVQFTGKWTMPRFGRALASVRITANGRLALEGTNMDVWASSGADAEIAQEGVVLTPAADLAAFCRFAPKAGNCTLTLDGDVLKASCGSARATFPTAPTDEYPPARAGIQMAEVDPAFARALRFCAPAMSNEQTRLYLNGILLDGERLISTDGHRLHGCGCGPVSSDPIIPREAVPDLAEMLAEGGRFGCDGQMWAAEANGTTLSGKQVEGPFPPNTPVAIANALAAPCVALCDRDDLIQTVKRASLGGDHGLQFTGSGGRITAALSWRKSAKLEATGSADCPAEIKGEFSVGLNARYVLDALSVLPDAEVEVLCAQPFVTFRPANRSAFLDCFAIVTEFRL